jgi:hypothetical protein
MVLPWHGDNGRNTAWTNVEGGWIRQVLAHISAGCLRNLLPPAQRRGMTSKPTQRKIFLSVRSSVHLKKESFRPLGARL